MSTALEEILPDGTRKVGDGPTYILFLPSGDVALHIIGERAERRALRKNYSTEVTVGNTMITIGDFSQQSQSVPLYSQSLATIVHSVVHTLDDEEGEKVLKRLRSVIRAARSIARDEAGSNQHAHFRAVVIALAKRFSRPPTRREIQREMYGEKYSKDHARQIAEYCEANGLAWIKREDRRSAVIAD